MGSTMKLRKVFSHIANFDAVLHLVALVIVLLLVVIGMLNR